MSTAASQKKVNIKTVFETILSAELQPLLETVMGSAAAIDK